MDERRKSSPAKYKVDHEEIGKLLEFAGLSDHKDGGDSKKKNVTPTTQRRHSEQSIPSDEDGEQEERSGPKGKDDGMNPHDFDRNRPKSFHTSGRHHIRFQDEVDEDSEADEDESDSSPDEKTNLKKGYSGLEEDGQTRETGAGPRAQPEFKKSSLRKKDWSSQKRRVQLQLGSVPEEDKHSSHESINSLKEPTHPNGFSQDVPLENGTGERKESFKRRRSGFSIDRGSTPMPVDERRRVLFDAPLESHELFVQLNEWQPSDPQDFYSDRHWKEKSRWIKFEEDWEQGAEKWGKPHVAHLTFHSLPELRRFMENGLVLLNVEESSLTDLIEKVLDTLQDEDLIQGEDRESLDPILFQITKSHGSTRPRNLRASMRRLSVMADRRKSPAFTAPQRNQSDGANPEEIKISILSRGSSASIESPTDQVKTAQSHLMKKIPANSEAAAILVAQDENIEVSALALVRLLEAQVFEGFLEVPIPVRFLCIFIGPAFSQHDYHEMGRAMGTLFSDELFRDSAYAANDKDDMMTGINGFLNDTMVLPPGEWDRDLLFPLTRVHKKENEKVQQRRKSMKPSRDDVEGLIKVPDSQERLYMIDPLKRTGHPFGGLVNDVRRRLPHYWADIRDGLNFHCLATFFFVFLACVAPAITFGGILGEKTDNWMGLVEMMISTSVCGMIFSLFSGQPLMIIGGTGPVLVFEEYLYTFSKNFSLELLPFRACIGIWVFIIATVVVALEGSILVKYFTRFTEEILAALISLIFIYETYDGLKYIFKLDPILVDYCDANVSYDSHAAAYYDEHPTNADLVEPIPSESPYGYVGYVVPMNNDSDATCGGGTDHPQPNVALMSTILTFGTFFIAYALRIFRYSRFLHREIRRALGDFGIAIAILTMVLVDAAVQNTNSQKVCIPEGLVPTKPGRISWFVNPMGLHETTPILAVFAAAIPAFLLFILLYMETLLTGMLVGKKEHQLKKGTGFHLDLFLMGVLSALSGLFGVPWMCAATVRTVSHIQSLSVMTRKNPPGVRPKLDYIIDQRLTNFLVSFCIGLLAFTSDLLENIPIPVLLGVFLYLGITSMGGLSLIERIKVFFMPSKHHPDDEFIRQVKLWKIHLFTLIQLLCLAGLWAVKNSIVAIAFPFFLILLVIFRHGLRFFFFNAMDLEALDGEEDEELQEHRD